MAALLPVSLIAQLSTLLPILYQILIGFLRGEFDDDEGEFSSGVDSTETGEKRYVAVPGDREDGAEGAPARGAAAAAASKESRNLSLRMKKVSWWLSDEIFAGWGTRGEWLFGIVWTLWLVVLALHTSEHGLMAVSQTPTCVLLAMKSPYSPFQSFLHLSHDALDPYHRVLGRIIILLGTAHACLYMLFFFQAHITVDPSRAYIVVAGLGGVYSLWILGIGAIGRMRRWSYRVFMFTHHFMIITFSVFLFIHVRSARLLMLETLVFYVINTLLRKYSTSIVEADISFVADSDVVKVRAAIPSDMDEYPAGATAYFSTHKRPKTQSVWPGYFGNPFSVDFDPTTRTLTAYMKTRGKRTNAFKNSSEKAMIAVEGPYGKSAVSSEGSLGGLLIQETDRTLIVAGGVGATFGFSVARDILATLQQRGASLVDAKKRLKVLWVVPTTKDLVWADEIIRNSASDTTGTNGSILSLKDVLIINVTRPGYADVVTDLSDLVEDDNISDDEDVASGIPLEMKELKPKKSQNIDLNTPSGVQEPRMGRPDLNQEVADFLSEEFVSKMAGVVVCGPAEMCRIVRKSVNRAKGRGDKVYLHEESFGQ